MSEASGGIEIDPAAFLTRTCERLAAAEGTDLDVSTILTTMLTSDTGPNAGILTAREALRQLAISRAATSKSQADADVEPEST